jgi:hypothetical protein
MSQSFGAAASSTTSATQSVAPKSDSITPGALAGGIVGAFFGGAILAVMAAYFFSRRRKSPPFKSRGSKVVESVHGAPTRKPPRPPVATNAWERLIPQPVDDETMSSHVKSLLDRVVLHVDNFYARQSLQISPSDVEAFAKVDTELLPSPLPEVMMEPNLQMLAIKHCIAFTLADSIMPGDDPSNKILPIYLAALPRKLAPEPDSENDLKGKIFRKNGRFVRRREAIANQLPSSGARSLRDLEIPDIVPAAETSSRAHASRPPPASHRKHHPRPLRRFSEVGGLFFGRQQRGTTSGGTEPRRDRRRGVRRRDADRVAGVLVQVRAAGAAAA